MLEKYWEELKKFYKSSVSNNNYNKVRIEASVRFTLI